MEQILKTGNGRLYGVSNAIPQKGKMLWMYDGTTVIGAVHLDEAFPDREVTYTDGGEVVVGYEPGMVFDSVFNTELRIVTDGEELTYYWT